MNQFARFLAFAASPIVLLTGCMNSMIWNSGDLEKWVKEQAVTQGVERESIKLEDWYVEENGQNVWKGTGTDASTGLRRQFSITVDKVWKPSS